MGLGWSGKDLKSLPGRNHLTAGSLRIRPKTGFPSGPDVTSVPPPPNPGGKGLCPVFRAELCSPQNSYVEVKLCLLKFIC